VSARSIVVDEAGNTYIAGDLGRNGFEPADFGAGPVDPGGFLFLVKLDAQGQASWSWTFNPAPQFMGGWLGSLSVARNGDVFVGADVFRDEPGVPDLSRGSLVFRLDAAGTELARYEVEYDGHGSLKGVSEGSDGEVRLWGMFDQGVSSGSETAVSAGNYDVYVTRFHADGSALGIWRRGDERSNDVTALALDAAGNVVLVERDVSIDAEGFGIEWRARVSALNPAMEVLWQHSLGAPSTEQYDQRLALNGAEVLVSRDEAFSIPKRHFIERLDLHSGQLIQAFEHSWSPDETWAVANPVLAPDGGVLLFSGGEVVRLTSDGQALWSTSLCAGWAIEVTDVVYREGTPLALVAFSGQLQLGNQEIKTNQDDEQYSGVAMFSTEVE
jgi:hypothetical protein